MADTNAALSADLETAQTELDAVVADRDRYRQALEDIRSTPHSMVNDSESLRHTLRGIDYIARIALRQKL